GLRDDAKVAGERDLEADAETIAAIGGDHRLGATCRRGDVPGEFRDVLGRCLQETTDIAAGREMLAFGAQHDHPHAPIFIERLECGAKLLALVHGDRVHRRASKNDIGAFAAGIDLDAKAVEVEKSWIGRFLFGAHDTRLSLRSNHGAVATASLTYSPAIRLRRRSL